MAASNRAQLESGLERKKRRQAERAQLRVEEERRRAEEELKRQEDQQKQAVQPSVVTPKANPLQRGMETKFRKQAEQAGGASLQPRSVMSPYMAMVQDYFKSGRSKAEKTYDQVMKRGIDGLTNDEWNVLLSGESYGITDSMTDFVLKNGMSALKPAVRETETLLGMGRNAGAFDIEGNISKESSYLLSDDYIDQMIAEYERHLAEADARKGGLYADAILNSMMAAQDGTYHETLMSLDPTEYGAYEAILDAANTSDDPYGKRDAMLQAMLDWDAAYRGTTPKTLDELFDMDDDAYKSELARLLDLYQATPWGNPLAMTGHEDNERTQAQLDILHGEQGKRSKIKEMQTRAASAVDFDTDRRYTGTAEQISADQDKRSFTLPFNAKGAGLTALGIAAMGAGPVPSLLAPGLMAAGSYVSGTGDDTVVRMPDFSDDGMLNQLYHYVNGVHDNADDLDALTASYFSQHGWDMMTPEQIGYFNYFYANDKKMAKEYVTALQSELWRYRAMVHQAVSEKAAIDPVTGVPTWAAEGLLGVTDLAALPAKALAAGLGVDDPNAPWHDMTNIRSYTSQARSDWLSENTGGPQILGRNPMQWVDTAAGATRDFAVALAAGNAMSANPATAAKFTGGLMSAQSASSDLTATAGDDMSGTGRLARAVATGALEALTEKYSIEALLGDPKTIRGYLLKNIVSEGGEELASSVGQTVIDSVVSYLDGSKSDLLAECEALVAAGKTRAEAERQVMMNAVQGALADALVGGMTGGVISVPSSIATYTQRRSTGTTIRKNDGAEQLIKIGESMDAGTQSSKLATEIRNSGKKPSVAQLGRLYATLVDEVPAAYQDTLQAETQDAIAAEIGSKREAGNDKPWRYTDQQLAEGIVALAAGKRIKAGLRTFILNHKSTRMTLREYEAAVKGTDDGESESAWVSGLGQRRSEVTKRFKGMEESLSELLRSRSRPTSELPQTGAAPDGTGLPASGLSAQEIINETEETVRALTGGMKGDRRSMSLTFHASGLSEGRGELSGFTTGNNGELVLLVTGEDGTHTVKFEEIGGVEGAEAARLIAYAEQHQGDLPAEAFELMLDEVQRGGIDAADTIEETLGAYDAGYYDMPAQALTDEQTADVVSVLRARMEQRQQQEPSQEGSEPGAGSGAAATYNPPAQAMTDEQTADVVNMLRGRMEQRQQGPGQSGVTADPLQALGEVDAMVRDVAQAGIEAAEATGGDAAAVNQATINYADAADALQAEALRDGQPSGETVEQYSEALESLLEAAEDAGADVSQAVEQVSSRAVTVMEGWGPVAFTEFVADPHERYVTSDKVPLAERTQVREDARTLAEAAEAFARSAGATGMVGSVQASRLSQSWYAFRQAAEMAHEQLEAAGEIDAETETAVSNTLNGVLTAAQAAGAGKAFSQAVADAHRQLLKTGEVATKTRAAINNALDKLGAAAEAAFAADAFRRAIDTARSQLEDTGTITAEAESNISDTLDELNAASRAAGTDVRAAGRSAVKSLAPVLQRAKQRTSPFTGNTQTAPQSAAASTMAPDRAYSRRTDAKEKAFGENESDTKETRGARRVTVHKSETIDGTPRRGSKPLPVDLDGEAAAPGNTAGTSSTSATPRHQGSKALPVAFDGEAVAHKVAEDRTAASEAPSTPMRQRSKTIPTAFDGETESDPTAQAEALLSTAISADGIREDAAGTGTPRAFAVALSDYADTARAAQAELNETGTLTEATAEDLDTALSTLKETVQDTGISAAEIADIDQTVTPLLRRYKATPLAFNGEASFPAADNVSVDQPGAAAFANGTGAPSSASPAASRRRAYETAYRLGRRAAQTDEQNRRDRTQNRRSGSGTVSYMGDVGNTTDLTDTGTRQKLGSIRSRLSDQQNAAVDVLGQIARATGVDIVLYESSAADGESLNTPNGMYEGGRNAVYIDLNSGASRGGETLVTSAILRTAGHELTHWMENNSADAYARLRSQIRQLLSQRGQDYARLVRGKMQSSGLGLSRAAAEAEVIADACEMMLQDTDAVSRLAKNDPGLLEKIAQFLRAFARRLKRALEGVRASSREAQVLMEVRDGAERYIDGLQKLWDDAAVEAAKNRKNDNAATENGEKRYSYAGRGSKTQNESRLKQAQELEQSGALKEEIRQKTGWFRGMDGQWRYEIDDSKMKIVEVDTERVLMLSELLEHHSLFEAYPELKDTPVIFTELNENTYGRAIGRGIMLNEKHFGMPGHAQVENRRLKSTLLHEIQHQIQRIEGFAAGSNQRYWQEKLDAGVRINTNDAGIKKAEQTRREYFEQQSEEIKSLIRQHNQLMSEMREQEMKFIEAENVEDGEYARHRISEIMEQASELVDRAAQLDPENDPLWTYDMMTEAIRKAKAANRPMNSMELYRMTAGEIEARDVADRMGLEDEQRRMLPPANDANAVFVGEPFRRQYSSRTPAPSLRSTLAAMEATEDMNETERYLLDSYKKNAAELSELQKKIRSQAALLAIDSVSADEKRKARERLKIYRTQARRAEQKLRNAEKSDGFAGMLDTAYRVAREMSVGDNLETTVKRLEDQLRELRGELSSVQDELQGMNTDQAVQMARSLFDPKILKDAAWKLRSSYSSSMQATEIENRLAVMYTELYQGDGNGQKRYNEHLKELAAELLRTSRTMGTSETLEMLREGIGSIRLTDYQITELKANGVSLKEFRRVVNPVVRISTRHEANDLMAALSGAEYFGPGSANGVQALFEGYENEGDAIMRLYDLVKSERGNTSIEGMSEEQSLQMAMMDIIEQAALPYPNGGAAEAVADTILSTAQANERVQQRLNALMDRVRRSTNAAWEARLQAARQQGAPRKAAEYYRKLEEQRRLMEVEEETIRVREQLTAENNEKLREMRRELQEAWDERMLLKEVTEANARRRRAIRRVVTRLDRLMRNETDQRHVPEGFKPVVQAMMEIFLENRDSFNAFEGAKAADMAAAAYAQLRASDGNDLNQMAAYYDEDIAETLEELRFLLSTHAQARYSVTPLDKAQWQATCLDGILEIADHIWHLSDGIDKAIIGEKQVELARYASGMRDELEKRSDYRKLTGVAGRILEEVDKGIQKGNMTAPYFFRFVGIDALTQLNNDVFTGQERYAHRIAEAQAFVQEQQDKYHYWAWKDDEALTFTTAQGFRVGGGKHTVTMTKEQAMAAYASWKREHQRSALLRSSHLENGGFVYEGGMRRDGRHEINDAAPHKLTEADMRTIENYLTDEQKAYADAIVDYASSVMAEYGNETSMELHGIRKFREGYYYPFHVQRGQLAQKSSAGSTRGGEESRVSHLGMTKRRVNMASNPLVLGDFTQTMAEHFEQMITYSSFAVPIENMNRVLNMAYLDDTDSRMTVRLLLEQKLGKNAYDYLTRYIADLNGGIQADKLESSLIGKGAGLMKKAAVVASVSVALQQPTAIVRSMYVLSPRWYLASRDVKTPLREEWAQLKQHSGVAIIKEMGRFDMGVGRKNVDNLTGQREDSYNTWQKLRAAFLMSDAKGAERFQLAGRVWDEAFGFLANKADQIAWVYMWRAVKKEQEHLHPEMDHRSSEFLDLCGRRFNEMANLTQVYDSTLVRSQNMRSNSAAMKMLTQFAAEPTLTANMLRDAFARKGAGVKGKAVAVYLVSQVAAAAAAALIKAGRDDDDEKTYLEKYIASVAGALGGWSGSLNPLALLPGVRDVMSLLDGYDVERSDMSLAADLINAGDKLLNGKYKTSMDALQDFGGTVAGLLGVPAKNIIRDLRSVWQICSDVQTYDRLYNAEMVKKSLLDGFSVRFIWEPDTSVTAYYSKLCDAMLAGDKERERELREYLGVIGKDAETISKGLVEVVKGKYMSTSITAKDAQEFLLSSGLREDKKEAFATVDAWAEKSMYESASVYNSLYTAIDSGVDSDINASIKELTDNGWELKDVQERVRTYTNEQYYAGRLTQAEVKRLYLEHGGYKTDPPKGFDPKDEDDWYWKFEEMDAIKKNGSGTNYTKTGKLHTSLESGNAASIKAAMKELTDHGSTQKEVESKVRSHVNDMYYAGSATQAEVKKLYLEYGGYKTNAPDGFDIDDPNDWYWIYHKLDYGKANGGSTDGYSKYGAFYTAVESGKNLRTTINDYAKHGVEKGTLASAITGQYKNQLITLYKTDRTAFANLQARILTAYEALGYDRNKKLKDIQKWLQ